VRLLNKILNIFSSNNSVINYSPYSFSKIDTWKRCPYKFKLKYIDKIRIPFEPNLALLKGVFLHYCIEKDTNGKEYTTNEIFTEEEKVKAIKIFNKFKDSKFYNFYLSNKGKHEIGFGISKKDKNLKVTYYNDMNNLFKGKIDYIFQKENNLYIVDWKSGKYIEQDDQKFDQLLLYAIWGFLKYENINTINCSFLYIEQLKENKVIYHRKNLKSYIEKYIEDINKIELDESFDKIESEQCDYCEYRKFDYCMEEK
jgi:CRISPR/Cas system-associated exonuclease Cas4 (RecB family)